eukprot:4274944-Prorocentrum_lima.AAC.1
MLGPLATETHNTQLPPNFPASPSFLPLLSSLLPLLSSLLPRPPSLPLFFSPYLPSLIPSLPPAVGGGGGQQ